MKVNIQSLKNGHFELDDVVDFSTIELENEDVDLSSPLSVHVSGEKFNLNYRLKISFKGDVTFPCDRCSEPFVFGINDSVDIVYTKVDLTDDQGDEEIVRIDNDSTEIDIKDVLLDAIVVSFPMKRLHDETCKGICECGSNLNIESCSCEEKIDPRWEALVKLKNRN